MAEQESKETHEHCYKNMRQYILALEDHSSKLERALKESDEGHILTNKGLMETIDKLEARCERYKVALEKIRKRHEDEGIRGLFWAWASEALEAEVKGGSK
jgi:hypothetical protein